MRQLKHHEQKLLKKADFLTWKKQDNDKESLVIRRYHLQNRMDYVNYNRLCGSIKKVAHRISLLPKDDSIREKFTNQLLSKLESVGVIPIQKSLAQCEKVTVSSFCRRRLAVLLVRYKMAENMKSAVSLIEQGHIRVGTERITDPSFLVTKNMEDFVTWVDSSKVKRKILKYNDKLDDYDLL